MTPDEFKSTQAQLDLTNVQLAELLSCSTSLITKYRSGTQAVARDTAIAMRLMVVARDTVGQLREAGHHCHARRLHYCVESVIT